MKLLPLLRLLTNILFVLILIGVLFYVPFLLIAIIFPEKVPFDVNGVPATFLAAEDYLMLSAKVIAFAFWAYGLYFLKASLVSFGKNQFFSEKAIKPLDQAGRALLIGLFIDVAATFVYNAIVMGEFNPGVGIYSVLTLIFGLSLIVLSGVLSAAKVQTEENTIP